MNSTPKVFLLGPLPPPYIGPAVATKILIKSELNKKFQIFHYNTNTHVALASIGKFTIRRLFRNIKLYIRFAWLLIKEKPDLVIIPISETTLGYLKDSVFMLISKGLSMRTLLQLRGGNFKNWLNAANPFIRLFVSLTLKPMNGVIVLGNKLKYLFSDYFPASKIYIIPNGGNFNYSPKPIKKDPIVRLLFISNLLPSKGIEDVIRSLIFIQKNILNNITLDVVGEWGDENTKKNCIKLVNENSLPVFFHQGVQGSYKANYFNKSDIFIFPPCEQEGHPWVLVEAMAAGLPIISTDQGAITESVNDGINGFIVDKKRPKEIAEKIEILIDNPKMRIEMGRRSRMLYLENFTESKMVVRYAACFNDVLKS